VEQEIEEQGWEGCDSIDISKIQYIEMRNIIRLILFHGYTAILPITKLIAYLFFTPLKAKSLMLITILDGLPWNQVNFQIQNQFRYKGKTQLVGPAGSEFILKLPILT
jgi:hypothetical protein